MMYSERRTFAPHLSFPQALGLVGNKDRQINIAYEGISSCFEG